VAVYAEDAAKVHLAFELRLDGTQLDPAMLGDGRHARSQAACKACQHELDRSCTPIFRGENLRMVGLECKGSLVALLLSQTVKAQDAGAAVRAPNPLAGRPPGELRGLGRLPQSLARLQQCLGVDTVVDVRRCHGMSPPIADDVAII